MWQQATATVSRSKQAGQQQKQACSSHVNNMFRSRFGSLAFAFCAEPCLERLCVLLCNMQSSTNSMYFRAASPTKPATSLWTQDEGQGSPPAARVCPVPVVCPAGAWAVSAGPGLHWLGRAAAGTAGWAHGRELPPPERAREDLPG